MERIRALILKLQEQSEKNADVSAMMATVQMLQRELSQLSATVPKRVYTANVAVVLPSSANIIYPVKEVAALPDTEEVKNDSQKQDSVSSHTSPNEETAIDSALLKEKRDWSFNAVNEIPTLAHQKEFKEMNDVFGQPDTASLNDKLKSGKTELASVLTEGPVRDLKKAIGVNDRFVFVSELFRGDEAMYERSVKTINNFRIHPEAEYWIERELKTKLGWDENKEPVKQFRQLVRRRFA